MRLNRYPARLAMLLPIMFACSLSFAQQTGLRLGPQFGLRENPIGLKLRFVDSRSPMFSLPADNYLAPPGAKSSLVNGKTYSSLIADWQLNANGLRASAGLVLRYRTSRIPGEELRRGDNPLQGTPETYFGLGWNGEPFGAGSWQFSADVGSFVSTKAHCKGPGCTSSSLGFRPEVGGSGIRWTPYVAIGAQLNY